VWSPFRCSDRVLDHSVVDKPLGAAGRVDRGGQLFNRAVEHGHVIGDGVGAGVARAQSRGQRLAGSLSEAEHWIEAEPAPEVRGGALFVLGVDLHDGRVDVEGDGLLLGVESQPVPHRGAHLGGRLRQLAQGFGVEFMEGPVNRRVTGDRAEQIALQAQVLNVRAALAPAGEHRAAVVRWRTFAVRNDAR